MSSEGIEITIERNDVLKHIYFIVKMTQNQEDSAMYGTLAGKSDYMGGIFDRFINTLPESLIFNKAILPDIIKTKKIEVITDFYFYDPTKAGIAPDVIGIKVDGKPIPFAIFDKKWKPIKNAPQIELKTFKKKDYMVSLRNQNYDGKYLVMTTSNSRVDYLLPFFDKKVFDESIFNEMSMDDSVFIKDSAGLISKVERVNLDSDSLGTVSLLKITTSTAFMDTSIHCLAGTGIEWLKNIEEMPKCKEEINIKLSEWCNRTPQGLYRFNDKWYVTVGADGIPLRTTTSRSGRTTSVKYKTLDFQSDAIDKLVVVKRNKYDVILKALDDSNFNKFKLKKDKYYRVSYCLLDRSGSTGDEYFLQKDLVPYLPSREVELKDKIKKMI